MANIVEILITNSEGKRFVVTNHKMGIGLAKQFPSVTIEGAAPTDIILSDWSLKLCDGRYATLSNYIILEKSDSEEISKKIMSKLSDMLKKQYERKMMIRVVKKYFSESIELELLKLQLECCDKKNYMIDLQEFKKNMRGE